PYPFSLVDAAGRPLPLDDALFAVSRSGSDGNRTVTFDYSGPEGSATKSFTFHDRGLFDAEVKVRRAGAPTWRLFFGPGLRNPSADEEKSRFEKPAAVYAAGSSFERLGAKKAEETVVIPGGGLRWVGLEDTYFLAALIPRNDTLAEAKVVPYLQRGAVEGGDAASTDNRFEPIPADGELADADEDLLREYALLLASPRDGDNIELHAYLGAKKLSRLAELPYGLEQTVNLGWFGFLARWILKGLIWIHANVVANYGWSIVLMTLLIKLILLPLTHKSYVSMRKMQEINPQMQAIRAKWRGKMRDKNGKMNFDAQRQMNEEMQKLYREAGVNPIGGCLPMVLQMPVLFAFYQLLYSAVELRGEPWILWITDLTQPFWPLAVVMGGTQFLQMRMTPTTGDPMQRRLMMFMPVVFTIFFLGFPSGLVLYWLTNNVLTIVQQGLYNQWKKKQENKASDGPDEGKKKAGAHKGGKGSRRVAAK
ncbi:MAG TPA: YidC/Oxa1 family insertase periplasmic-domain containing protein, partial [Thermoanaerobaculia bacterium]|nr:YidC/Oxa1 family insertase periplasmic-domain containing protein [Thermoanaerobaculia bacterium]